MQHTSVWKNRRYCGKNLIWQEKENYEFKEKFCIYIYKKQELMQEQRSEVKASCLFHTALALMTTNYTPVHAISKQKHIHVTSTQTFHQFTEIQYHDTAAELHSSSVNIYIYFIIFE
jgi:hypothetical protein